MNPNTDLHSAPHTDLHSEPGTDLHSEICIHILNPTQTCMVNYALYTD